MKSNLVPPERQGLAKNLPCKSAANFADTESGSDLLFPGERNARVNTSKAPFEALSNYLVVGRQPHEHFLHGECSRSMQCYPLWAAASLTLD